jgi:hypothetical protein
LIQIYEYFADEIVDNFSGKRSLPPEVLSFADQGVNAAKKEFAELNKFYPADSLKAILDKLESEYSPNSNDNSST